MTVVGKGCSEDDAVRVPAGWVFHIQVRFGNRPSLRVHLLAEEMNLGVRIDRAGQQVAVIQVADVDALLGDGQHSARTTAGIIDSPHHAALAYSVFISSKHQADHEVYHVAGCKVLTRIFVQRFVEPADQFLENCAHRGVVNAVGMKVNVPESLQHLEEQARLIEFADGVVEVEPFQDLAHILAETRDVVPQVGGDVGGVREQPLEVVPGSVVEGETGR